jgi:4-amino-4-deoxy-L-arabinose transferase-like glycosyltransferase
MLHSPLVETHQALQSEANALSPGARVAWSVLIVATLCVCYFSHLGAIGFVGPDEPRYAWVARDMAETGDWVTPRLYGKPWFEKPPLFYWGAALSFKLFGVSEAAARLPSAISALLATLALAWLALRLSGAETARWLLLLLPTTVGMIGFSHAAATDMPFSAMLTIAMVCAAVVLGLTRNENTPILPRTPWLALLLFGFFLGLAVLAKGPAAIILSGGAIFFWALFTKRWRDAFRLFHPVAIASFCLTALPWYILCARRNPDFFRIFILEHNFKRYLTPEFQHLQPFWYYGPIILIAMIPWSVLIVSMVVDAARSFREGQWKIPNSLFLAFWTLFPLAFFSFSQSKLPGYALPVLPPLSALAARSLVLAFQRSLAAARWVAIAVAMLLMAPAGVFWYLALIPADGTGLRLLSAELLWASLCALVGLLALILALWNRPRAAFLIAVVVVLSSITGIHRALKNVDVQNLSILSSVQAARNRWTDFAQGQASSFKLRRADQYGLNFYLHREVPSWSKDHREPGWVFGTKNLWGDSWTEGMDCIFMSAVDTISQPVVCKNPRSWQRLVDSLPDRRQPH